MITTAVILDAGKGSKLWPYAQIRSKGMLPVCNKPVLRYITEALQRIGIEDIIIVGGAHAAAVRNHFRQDAHVRIVDDPSPRGTAFSLCAAKECITKPFLALNGDTLLDDSDLRALAMRQALPAVLAVPFTGASGDYITCNVSGESAASFTGHPRGEDGHYCAGFAFAPEHFALLERNAGRFTNTQVGMMSPLEGFIEMSLNDHIKDGGTVAAVQAKQRVIDIDKPCRIMEADEYMREKFCGALTENILAQGAEIHAGAEINGFVQLGEGSKIGRNVLIEGCVIAGKNSRIDNGAILRGNIIIGDDCTVRDSCLLDGATVGNRCYVGHGAELSGIIFDKVYLYHYMEINGIVGENTDIGAATVCGSLRFDDGITRQRIKGRLEQEHPAGDACFIGDYCRTGVNAILMPGVKTGVYSIVGAGVNLAKDLEDNTLIYAEQTHIKKAWGPERYGW